MKTALVTGSARRLGREIALRLAASGYFTCVHYRGSRAAADGALKAIRKAGGDGAVVSGDLGSPEGVREIVAGARAALGSKFRLDVLVNNVGIYPTGPLEGFDPDSFDEVLRVNLSGCHRLIQMLHPNLRKGGSIINIGYAGIDSLTATTHNTAYMISKSGLLILTKSLAMALGPRGIRVNMVSPGILTNSVELPDDPADFIPMERLGTTGEVADAVEFLVGDKARYITGVNLDVAGGYHLALRSLESTAPRVSTRRPRTQG